MQTRVFVGRMTSADSLENLHCYPLPDAIRDNFISREKQNGAMALRSSFQTELLPSPEGITYVMHIRGPFQGLQMTHLGNRTNNHLLAWQFGHDFSLQSHNAFGFQNQSKEELYESFSWRPLWANGKWLALFSDYSAAKREGAPWNAASYLWDLQSTNFEKVYSSQKRGFEVLCPREMVALSDGKWVGIAVSATHWRLIQMKL
jgi:hypothetical protein